MSGHPHVVKIPPPEFLGAGRYPLMLIFAGVAAVGILLSIVGIAVDHVQFAYSWFFAFYYFFTIALGAFFWVTLHYACDSDWSVLPRRIWENMLQLFPVLAIIFIPCLWPDLRDVLWKWSSYDMQNDHEVVIRAAWLNPPFFYFRVFAYFIYFILAGFYYRRLSVRQDVDGNPVYTRHLHDHSYLALVIFGLLQTFLACDWLAGLDWKWSSSLFGVYNFGVCVPAGLCAGIVLIALFRKAGYLQAMNTEHFFLMGKLLFGFCIFWSYVAFGQYLLIWYANIPEETIFYNNHNRDGWRYLTYFLAAGKYVFPVVFLLAQDNKKSLRALTFISAWYLVMHAVELYWFVGPFAHPHSVCPSWQDFVAWITVGSILGFFYLFIAARRSLFRARTRAWSNVLPSRTDMDAEITYHRLKYGWLVGLALAFCIFAVVALYSARMTRDYPGYDSQRGKERKATLEKVQKDENALLNPVDDKGNPSATWVDQDKGLIQIPIEEAMAHELVDLKNQPVGVGAEIPGSTPASAAAPAPAAAAPAAPAAPASTNAAPAKPAQPAAKKPAKPKNPAKPVKTTSTGTGTVLSRGQIDQPVFNLREVKTTPATNFEGFIDYGAVSFDSPAETPAEPTRSNS